MDISSATSDFNQWLHAMKMVARLQGGIPPEFRRKLWLALAEKYLQTRNVNWSKEQEKCFNDQWHEEDDELDIQIVKDLHRTGSSLCSGPTGSINQAKLKRILLGYGRWNPEVGYCQGFNMLGALILQVMDKNEIESIKVMIFLVEGVLPPGYFSGSLGGLQADMAVFREIMTKKLPKLAKHLQKLQGPLGEGSFEPPLTNVFTMQWFLTLFCTCLPINCVLRIWDLALIEGSDVLLRTALAIWSFLEEKILSTKTADDFYCKMGILSRELLTGHLIDSNRLIEQVASFGPIPALQELRDKHLYNIAPWRDKKELRLFYSDDEGDSDDDSRLAVTAIWGLKINRRSSISLPSSSKLAADNKDRLALDISLLKKQYDRLRERQRQAHIILTAAIARQGVNPTSPSIQMNQLLNGKNAITTNNGLRIGPPQGAIPPARTANGTMKLQPKQLRRIETVNWREIDSAKKIESNMTFITSGQTSKTENLNQITTASSFDISSELTQSTAMCKTRKRSESSSYSEDSDTNSSTSTSLCDEYEKGNICPSLEEICPYQCNMIENEVPVGDKLENKTQYVCTINDHRHSEHTNKILDHSQIYQIPSNELTENRTTICFEEKSIMPNIPMNLKLDLEDNVEENNDSVNSSVISTFDKMNDYVEISKSPVTITSTSQLSPIADLSTYLSTSSISPLEMPSTHYDYTDLISSRKEITLKTENHGFDVSEEGVTNKYFERINAVERPCHLDLISLNDIVYTTNPKNYDDDISEGVGEETSKVIRMVGNNIQKGNILTSYRNISTIIPEAPYHILPNAATESITSSELEMHRSYPKDYGTSSSVNSIVRHSVIKEKSNTLGESIRNLDHQEPRPRSCPEVRVSISEKRNSDHILKIIEENSLILHRILRKNIEKPNNAKVGVKFINNAQINNKIENQNQNFSTLSLETEAINKQTEYGIESNCNRQQLRNLNTTNKAFRPDNNIADRLASIKNTIKSIDSLCDQKISCKRDRYQQYIDSLFEENINNSHHNTPNVHICEPKLRNTTHLSVLENSNSAESFANYSRYSRDVKRDISPRRKRDDDREECSSQMKRDLVEKFNAKLKSVPHKCVEESPHSNTNDLRDFKNILTNIDKPQKMLNVYQNYQQGRTLNFNESSIFTEDHLNSETKLKSIPTNHGPSKIEIRHTTVTSTFYDRYLSQKRERNTRTSNAAISPIITKHFNSLELATPSSSGRSVKSAENSPSRQKFDHLFIYAPSTERNSTNCTNDIHIRSCDNIFVNLKGNQKSDIIASTSLLQSYSPLQQNSKISEMEIQLDLSKSHTENTTKC